MPSGVNTPGGTSVWEKLFYKSSHLSSHQNGQKKAKPGYSNNKQNYKESALCGALIVTKSVTVLCIAISFVFAIVYSGMRGIYFATLGEVGIPLHMTGVATGIISALCYLPDVYFAKLAGSWLDTYGNTGYDYIWIYTIACGALGVIIALITYRYSKKLERKRLL